MESEKVENIKKIANYCVKKGANCNTCEKCNETDTMLTCRSLMKELLTLINELEECSEKLKQFAERLKEKSFTSYGYRNEPSTAVLTSVIDETLKEMLGEE